LKVLGMQKCMPPSRRRRRLIPFRSARDPKGLMLNYSGDEGCRRQGVAHARRLAYDRPPNATITGGAWYLTPNLSNVPCRLTTIGSVGFIHNNKCKKKRLNNRF